MEGSKAQQALEIARDILKDCPSATDFHNALFGIYGKVGEMFPTQAEREAFIKTPEYQEIVRMRTELRKNERVSM
jgi:hypothetical protein